MGDAPLRRAHTLDPVDSLAIIETEAKPLVPAPPPVLAFERTSGTPDGRAAALDDIGRRVSGATLLIGDVWIMLEEAQHSRCGVKFSGCVHFRVRPTNAALKAAPDFIVHASHEEAAAQVETWAREPELAREQLRAMLRKLAEKVVGSYPWR